MVDFTKIVKKSIGKKKPVDKLPESPKKKKQQEKESPSRPLDHIFGDEKKAKKEKDEKKKFSEKLGELFGVEEDEDI